MRRILRLRLQKAGAGQGPSRGQQHKPSRSQQTWQQKWRRTWRGVGPSQGQGLKTRTQANPTQPATLTTPPLPISSFTPTPTQTHPEQQFRQPQPTRPKTTPIPAPPCRTPRNVQKTRQNTLKCIKMPKMLKIHAPMWRRSGVGRWCLLLVARAPSRSRAGPLIWLWGKIFQTGPVAKFWLHQ